MSVRKRIQRLKKEFRAAQKVVLMKAIGLLATSNMKDMDRVPVVNLTYSTEQVIEATRKMIVIRNRIWGLEWEANVQ